MRKKVNSQKIISLLLAIALLLCAVPSQIVTLAEDTLTDIVIVDDETESIGLASPSDEQVKVGSKSLLAKPNNGSIAYAGIYGADPLTVTKDISTVTNNGTTGALRFWFYIEDVSALETTKLIFDQGQIQLGSGKKPDTNCYRWKNWFNQITKDGWNEVILPFSQGIAIGTPDYTAIDTLFFRIYDTTFNTQVYFDDIKVSANTEPTKLPDDVVIIDDETESIGLASSSDEKAKVGTKSLLAKPNNGSIAYAGIYGADPLTVTKDISTVTNNGTTGALRFWFYIEDVSALDKTKAISEQGQIQMGNGKATDTNCYKWKYWIDQITKNGWNEVILPFSNASKVGTPDYTQIDTLWFRIYDSSFKTNVYIDDIRVTADTETRNIIDIPFAYGKNELASKVTIQDNAFEIDASNIDDPYFRVSVYIAKSADAEASLADIVEKVENNLLLSSSGTTSNIIIWKNFNFQPGWNTLYLPLSQYTNNTGFNVSKINYFRFIQNNSTSNKLNIKIKDLAIIAGSDVPEHNLVVNYSVDNKTGNLSVAKGKLLFNNRQTLVPKINVSNITNPHLRASIYIARTDDISSVEGLLKKFTIELTSSGKPDVAEFAWYNNYEFTLKAGWNTVYLPFSKARITNGGADITALNYIRFVHNPSDTTVAYNFKVKDVAVVSYNEKYIIDSVYGNGMLFQKNKDAVITGSGRCGDTLDVVMTTNDGVEVSKTQVKVDGEGRFTATLPGQNGGYTEYDIKFNVDGNTVATLEDVVFGELWLAAGQSNMELNMSQDLDGKIIAANPTDKYIKILTMNYSSQDGLPSEPVDGRTGCSWGDGSMASSVKSCSAVGYYHAAKLREELDMPVGIIDSNLGGTHIYGWLSRETIENDETVLANVRAGGYYINKNAWNPSGKLQMTAMYNTKIAPLANISIAGTIWYQGCANVNDQTGHYAAALELLLKSYSDFFGFENSSMPLIVSHLHPYDFDNRNAAKFNNEFSAVAAKYPNNVSQIAIYDLPVEYEGNIPIHPTRKSDIGKRMAVAALGLVYGKNDTVTSPSFEGVTAENGAMLVKFKNLGSTTLAAKNGKALDGFAVAGADGVYMPAKAQIVSADTVKVWNISITNPESVTYAYTAVNNTANLVSVDANGEVVFAIVPFCSNVRDDDTLYRPVAWLSSEALTYWRSSGDATKAGWHDIWSTDSDATTVALDTENKTDGASSLKISYTANSFSIAPNTTYCPETSLTKYGRLIFDIKTANELTLNITAEKTYTINASDKWQRFTVDLSDVSDMNELIFTFGSEVASGDVYIDNASLLAVTLDGDVDNNAEVGTSDLIIIRKSLLGVISEIGITDVNKDGYTNIIDLVRLKKMLASN